MPILTYTNPQPLSNVYTTQEAVSYLAVVTNTKDNEHIQVSNFRNALKVSMSKVVNMVGIDKIPKYGVTLQAALEGARHSSGLFFINLDNNTYSTPWRASTGLHEINRVSVYKQNNYTNLDGNYSGTPATDIFAFNDFGNGADLPATGNGAAWNGNLTKLDISELTNLNNQLNTQWRDSACWTWHGHELLIYLGENFLTYENSGNGSFDKPYTFPFMDISIFGYRFPVYDDLLPESTSLTWQTNLDIPDEYMDLVLLYAQQTILKQLNANQAEQQSVSAQIVSELQKLDMNAQAAVAQEAMSRDKRAYGDQTGM